MSIPVAVTAVKVLKPGFEVPDTLQRELRRADDFIRMAVVSCHEALKAAGDRKLEPTAQGIYVGTAYGPLETNFESLGSLINDGEGQISPTLFSHSVYNAAAGYVARMFSLMGPALTITNYGWPFIIALEEARLAVAEQSISRAVVIGLETYSELLADAYKRSYGVNEVPWYQSAAAWVIEPAEKVDRCLCMLESVAISEADCDPADYLTRNGEECMVNDNQIELARHAMASVEELSRLVSYISENKTGSCSWSCRAGFGEVRVGLSV